MRRGVWGIILLILVGWLAWHAPAHAATPLRKATITLSPNSGAVGTKVTIAGSGFPTACAGYILVDDLNTGVSYSCGGDDTFHATITWPDNLDDGQHTVEARGVFTGATATFTQISPTATPEPAPSVTPTLEPSVTAGAGTGGKTGGSTSTGGQNVSDFPATIALAGVCCSVGAIGAGVTVLIVALRRRERRMNPYIATPYVPPPPPPPPVPQNPDEPWVWPNDPYGR